MSGSDVDDKDCSYSQRDTDGDGVNDGLDICPDSPQGESVSVNGCSGTQSDMDGDGVVKTSDECPETPKGDTVDSNGCSSDQMDADGDGISDAIDECGDTIAGESVDEKGCATSQLDSDSDDVFDDIDKCPGTPSGQTVNALGCSNSQSDIDKDGVDDSLDQCPGTSNDETADEKGCSPSQTDTDGDGVFDNLDQCLETPTGETVDAQGCSEGQKDSDEDEINDDKDQCPNTPKADTVDSEGCTVVEQTYVPDDALEQYLIDRGIDDVLDDYVVTSSIIFITEVHLFEYPQLSDLTGLENFESLKILSLVGMELKSFEIEKYKTLERLSFRNVDLLGNLVINNSSLKLLTLDLTVPSSVSVLNNKNLKTIEVLDYSKFGSFEISNNPISVNMFFEDLFVPELIINGNKNLDFVFCAACDISDLKVINNEKLREFSFDSIFDGYFENLSSISFSNNPNFTKPYDYSIYPNLKKLDVSNSRFLLLDVSNIALTELNAINSTLSCIKVNPQQLGNIPAEWIKDAGDSYSLDCD